MLKKSLIAKIGGSARETQIVSGEGYRITVITDRLFRVEVAEGGFTDQATQSIWFRDLGEYPFTAEKENKLLKIKTDSVSLCFDVAKKKAVCVVFADGHKAPCTNAGNMKGTRRTLDNTFGRVKLDDGLLSKTGVSVFDDSASLILAENGEVQPRPNAEKDVYVFAYGKEYRRCVSDFYGISGAVPLVPRYALGTWWSRYRKYTQQEYMQLIQDFEDRDIPLTVATVDMDWHWVDVKERFGVVHKRVDKLHDSWFAGWTGYSWNTELFPDHLAFLQWLKDKQLRVTLNLHPSDGIRFFEDMYEEVARATGIDPSTKAPVKYKAADPTYLNAYFDYVLKPLEKEGVDFWWLDWQQGKRSEMEGLDPLWSCNHYHFLDNAENGQLPLTLSRYAGFGSHRYPLGFSGDSAINWKVLKFQPYFTANAANAGYTWWSHDIGGHTLGFKDDELYLRWIQYGVFSPILRLHSTSNDLLGKEPWKYSSTAQSVATEFLRLRHRMIPYLYTMDYRTHKDGLALCEPMYYGYPQQENAYKVENQYMFGTELMVCPIVSKQSDSLLLSSVTAWIPDGRWTDIFTGETYEGNRMATLFRDLATIPVLAKEGAIIPFSADAGNTVANPTALELWIYRGTGSFTLYEDGGTTDYEQRHVTTCYAVTEKDGEISFIISAAEGNAELVPVDREYVLRFKDAVQPTTVAVTVNGKTEVTALTADALSGVSYSLTVKCGALDTVTVSLKGYRVVKNQPAAEQISRLFSRWQAPTLSKSIAYIPLRKKAPQAMKSAVKRSLRLPSMLKKAVIEVLNSTKNK